MTLSNRSSRRRRRRRRTDRKRNSVETALPPPHPPPPMTTNCMERAFVSRESSFSPFVSSSSTKGRRGSTDDLIRESHQKMSRSLSLNVASTMQKAFAEETMTTSASGGVSDPPPVPPRPLETFLYDEEEGVYVDPPQADSPVPSPGPGVASGFDRSMAIATAASSMINTKTKVLRRSSQPFNGAVMGAGVTEDLGVRRQQMRRHCTVPVVPTQSIQTSGAATAATAATAASSGGIANGIRRDSAPSSPLVPNGGSGVGGGGGGGGGGGRRITPPAVQRAKATRTFSDGAVKLKKTLSLFFGGSKKTAVSKTKSDPESKAAEEVTKREEEAVQRLREICPNSGPITFAPPPPLPPRNGKQYCSRESERAREREDKPTQ